MGLGVRSGRWEVSDGIVLFASAVLLLSLALVMIDDAGTSVGAAAVPTSSHPALVQTQTSQLPAPTTTTTVPPTTTTTAPPPTTTTTAPPPTTTTTAPPAPPPPPASTALPAKGAATADGCSAALAYLSAYSAPGFTFECPGNALGHEAMTCINTAGVCSNERLIAIADPCAVAYMNEASNSWVMTGVSDAPSIPTEPAPEDCSGRHHPMPVETQNSLSSGSDSRTHPRDTEALHVLVDATCAESLQPAHLDFDIVDDDIEVHAVLHRLGLGHPLQEER